MLLEVAQRSLRPVPSTTSAMRLFEAMCLQFPGLAAQARAREPNETNRSGMGMERGHSRAGCFATGPSQLPGQTFSIPQPAYGARFASGPRSPLLDLRIEANGQNLLTRRDIVTNRQIRLPIRKLHGQLFLNPRAVLEGVCGLGTGPSVSHVRIFPVPPNVASNCQRWLVMLSITVPMYFFFAGS